MSSGFWAWVPRESESGIEDRIRLPQLTSAWDRILVGQGATADCRRKAQNDDLLCKIWKCAFHNAALEGLTHHWPGAAPTDAAIRTRLNRLLPVQCSGVGQPCDHNGPICSSRY